MFTCSNSALLIEVVIEVNVCGTMYKFLVDTGVTHSYIGQQEKKLLLTKDTIWTKGFPGLYKRLHIYSINPNFY